MVFYRTGPGPRIGMEGVWTSGNVETISQQLNQPASNYSASSYGTSTTGTSTGTGTSSGQGNKYPSVSGLGTGSSPGPASNYSVNTSTGSTHTTPPTTNYNTNTSSGTEYIPMPEYVPTTPVPSHNTTSSGYNPSPTESTPPPSPSSPSVVQVESTPPAPSVTKESHQLAHIVEKPREAIELSPAGITHLWIGWKIEPWEEDFVKKFIEAFEHGKHLHHPPIMLPMMGGAPVPGALASMPGAPAPGAPVVVLPPQGASNQQQLTV